MKNTFWKAIKAQAGKNEATILLYEQIGKDFWTDEGIAAKDFAADLAEIGAVTKINLRINTPGGSVFEGLAMINQLKTHPAKKCAYIDGVAASMGAYIAVSCDEVHMPENTSMMVHGAHAVSVGNSADMRKAADMLDTIDAGLLSILVKKNPDEKKMKEMMSQDTWLTAAECKEKGLCTHMAEPMQMAASIDLSKFKNVPEHVKALLTAGKDTAGGGLPAAPGAVSPTPGTDVTDALAARAAVRLTHGGEFDRTTEALLKKNTQGGSQHMKTCTVCGTSHEESVECPACAKAMAHAEEKIRNEEKRRDEITALGKKHKCDDLVELGIRDKATVEAFRAQVVAEESRREEIAAIGAQHKCGELAAQALKDKVSVDAFRKQVLALYKASPITQPGMGPGAGTKNRKDFETLDHNARAEFMKSGGKVTD